MIALTLTQDNTNTLVAPPTAWVTVLTNDVGNLTKTFFLDQSGKVHKQAAANLVYGRFQVLEVHDLDELNSIHDSLTHTQAVTYGRPMQDKGTVVAQRVTNPPVGAITRTRTNFQFHRTAGVLMLDYDPPKDRPALNPAQLVEVIRQSCAQLAEVGMLWRASASSGVGSAGISGQRIYIVVSDASDIPRIGKIIFDRLWLAGTGYYAISVSGQLLERGPVDTSVWKPEGLDFAARPVLKDGITRTSYPSEITGHGVLNAALFADLTEAEKQDLEKLKTAARDAIKPKTDAAKVKYVQDTLPLLASRLKALGKDADELTIGIILERAALNRVLMGDFPLVTADGKSVTVADILDNPEKWHATRVADPLEPEVDGRAGWLNLLSGGTPYLYSHLHHGTRYRLDRAPALIQVCTGELPRMVDSLAGLLKKSGQIFERGGGHRLCELRAKNRVGEGTVDGRAGTTHLPLRGGKPQERVGRCGLPCTGDQRAAR